MKKLSIGLIGYGIWGSKILKELIYLNACVHVLEVNTTLKTSALKCGADSFETDLGAFKKTRFDGLIIASPTSTHLPVIQEFASKNIPIFVEKPLTNNLKDLQSVQKLNLPNIYVMHIWKYHPGVRLLAKIASEGKIGEIKGAKSIRTNWTSPRKDTDSLWNLGIHDLSICELILGHIPKKKQAVCEKHEGRIRGVMAFLGDAPYYHFEVSNRYPDKQREIRVFGSEGVAILKDEKVDYVDVYYGNHESESTEETLESIHFDTTPPLRIELRVFLDYLNGGKAPSTDLAEGVRLIHHLVDIENLLKQ